MAFMLRYELSHHDIGVADGTFVAQILEKGHRSMAPDEMTPDQERYLGNWLKGLYDADKEGLSNDVFASCRPQDFYLIVPTLFSQTVLACSHGVFSFDAVKGGLECKFERFAIKWVLMTNRSQGNISHAIFDRWLELDGIACPTIPQRS